MATPNATPALAAAAVATDSPVGDLSSLDNGDWVDGGQLCNQSDPDLWFPEVGLVVGGLDNPSAQANAAQAICRRCPLMRPCLTWALSTGEQWGVWGGVPARVRQETRRRIKGDPARLAAEVDAEMERAALIPDGVRRAPRTQPPDPGIEPAA